MLTRRMTELSSHRMDVSPGQIRRVALEPRMADALVTVNSYLRAEGEVHHIPSHIAFAARKRRVGSLSQASPLSPDSWPGA